MASLLESKGDKKKSLLSTLWSKAAGSEATAVGEYPQGLAGGRGGCVLPPHSPPGPAAGRAPQTDRLYPKRFNLKPAGGATKEAKQGLQARWQRR